MSSLTIPYANDSFIHGHMTETLGMESEGTLMRNFRKVCPYITEKGS